MPTTHLPKLDLRHCWLLAILRARLPTHNASLNTLSDVPLALTVAVIVCDLLLVAANRNNTLGTDHTIVSSGSSGVGLVLKRAVVLIALGNQASTSSGTHLWYVVDSFTFTSPVTRTIVSL